MSPLTGAQLGIVSDIGTSLCVTSGAGCGKTSVLVARYIQYLREDLALGLERLAAITFTENAAAEMRQRIREACRREMADARHAGNTRRLAAWRNRYWDVDVAPIDTIHSFCGGLLRRYAIEAGLDPNFSLLDEAASVLMRGDVVRRTIEELLDADDADLLAVLEHYDLGPAGDLLAQMVAENREVLHRVAAPVMKRSDEEILRKLKQAVEEAAMAALRQWLALPAMTQAAAVLAGNAGSKSDKIEGVRAAAVEILERLRRARTGGLALAAAQELAGAINLRGGSAKAWPSGESFAAVKESLETIRDGCNEVLKGLVAFDETTERRHLALARAFYRTSLRLMAAYEAAKAEESALDFEDLQILARDLLRDNPRVLEDCRKRFRAILVDELQDTNLLQLQIVDLLVSGPAVPRNPVPLRPGAFFGVGDPKQSIYRFRGAEFAVFQTALDRVGAAGRRSLEESFRLHAGTAALVNHIFPPLMGDQYEPITGMREQKNPVVAELHHLLPATGNRFLAEEGHQEEARRVAARLREIVEGRTVSVQDPGSGAWRPAEYRDVAILMRRISHLHLYEQALEAARVPYYVVAGRGFYQQQEVRDVLALLRVLEDPSDELSLATVLRSPLFAVSDEGLFHLRQLGPTLRQALPAAASAEHLDAEDRRGLRRAAELLPRWTETKDRLGLADLVDHVALESGYGAAVIGKFGGERAYANLRQMVELARRFQAHSLWSLGDYIAYVTDFMKSEMREEQAPVEAPGANTVRLMTIHKAKGLEFPIVVVPDLAYVPQGHREDVLIHPATGVALRRRDEDGERQTSSALALARADSLQADRAETRRLLYVALTRARDYLILASHQGYNPAAQDTWLDALVGGLGVDLSPGQRDVRLPTGHTIRVTALMPEGQPPAGSSRRVGPRDLLVEGRVDWQRLTERGQRVSPQVISKTMARIGPMASPVSPPARTTATALAQYARCPVLYWWSEVLGAESPEPPATGAGEFSPQLWGAVSHRALELAVSPDEKVVAAAVAGALREAPPAPDVASEPLAGRLKSSLEAFWAGPLGRRVAGARRAYRELPFLMKLDATEVRGKIDLVFEGEDGRWELVDYKTSGPRPEVAEQAAEEHALQLGLYAMAAGRWLGSPVDRWSVYFLGSGTAVMHAAEKTELERICEAARQVLAGIAAGRFDRPGAEKCGGCRIRRLCSTTTL